MSSTITIRHRFSGVVIYTGQHESIREAVEHCVWRGISLCGADLSGADLAGADLTGAVLRWANLTGADITGADLTRANLRGANLSGANLRGANLSGADLTRADITGAVLSGADLTGANLSRANLRGASLRGAKLTGANLSRADLTRANLRGAVFRGATGLPAAPIVDRPHVRILEALRAGGTLDMGAWHTCDTTHCRAGWLICFAGEPGAALEAKLGANVAGALIAVASCPALKGRVPDWFATNEEALADIERLAKLEA